jgi:outer membrane protein OmpA-like peptidoglycan-associated protein
MINNYLPTLGRILALVLLIGTSATLTAQEVPVPMEESEKAGKKEKDPKMKKENAAKAERPSDMIEFGITPSYMWVAGDVAAEGGYGASVHFRKALDYVFSFLVDGTFVQMNGNDGDGDIIQTNQEFENQYIAGTGLAVMTLNNFRFDRSQKKVNYYIMAGAGANFFETEFNVDGRPSSRGMVESEFTAHAAAGAGITFRLGSRVNLGFEFQSHIPFGKRADLLDGYDTGRSTFRDVVNMAGLSINFNLGSKSKKTEPLYWVSPFDPIAAEIDKVASRVDDATRDTDGDGIVDAIDQEPNTPANVPVDTRGRTLDSDKDGIPDFRDREPFFPPRPGEEVDENGIVTNRIDKPVTEERVQEMIDAAISNAKLNSTTTVSGDLRELFIPMIYFPRNQHTVKYSDYGTLSSISSVMQGNPAMRLVVRGYTDKVGDQAANERLSYLRAKSVVDHLVNQHGVSRSRFVLQYRGEEDNIVPQSQTYLNRRVEFHSAESTDYEQEAPAGANNGSGGF